MHGGLISRPLLRLRSRARVFLLHAEADVRRRWWKKKRLADEEGNGGGVFARLPRGSATVYLNSDLRRRLRGEGNEGDERVTRPFAPRGEEAALRCRGCAQIQNRSRYVSFCFSRGRIAVFDKITE